MFSIPFPPGCRPPPSSPRFLFCVILPSAAAQPCLSILCDRGRCSTPAARVPLGSLPLDVEATTMGWRPALLLGVRVSCMLLLLLMFEYSYYCGNRPSSSGYLMSNCREHGELCAVPLLFVYDAAAMAILSAQKPPHPPSSRN